jgi:histidinol-phosphate aminotransferase
VAALASLGEEEEVARRRRLNAEGRGAVERALRDQGFEVAGPAVANFVYAEVGDDARALFEALLREGVIVRPLAAFGAPEAVRVTVGTAEENEIFSQALAAVRAQTR